MTPHPADSATSSADASARRPSARARWFALGVTALSLCVPSLAAAQSGPGSAHPSTGLPRDDHSFSERYSLPLAASYTIAPAGYVAATGSELEPLTAGLILGGGMLAPAGVHFGAGEPERAAISAGGQVGAVLGGGAAGYGIGSLAGADLGGGDAPPWTATPVLIGAGVGYATWAVLDTVLFSSREVDTEPLPWSPYVTPLVQQGNAPGEPAPLPSSETYARNDIGSFRVSGISVGAGGTF